MANQPIIALDAMGGDHGPDVTVPAALDSLAQNPSLKVILVGDEDALQRRLPASHPYGDRLSIYHASERVEMDDSPAKVLRTKRDSSMRVALNLVRDGQAHACVSAGNTGALMAISRFVLKTIPGIDRPAIISALPSHKGHTHVLDLGANVDCTAEHLYQFAVMGYELVRAVENTDTPTVGLLNIGEEQIKGNEQVKEAYKLLSGSHLNFVGYVEGDDIYMGDVDIIVTDGFVGNTLLKTSEGLVKLIRQTLRESFTQTPLNKLAGLIAKPSLAYFRERFDTRRYNGASLVGLRGIVVKSHGNADQVAFANAVRMAVLEVEKDVPQRIGERIEAILAERASA